VRGSGGILRDKMGGRRKNAFRQRSTQMHTDKNDENCLVWGEKTFRCGWRRASQSRPVPSLASPAGQRGTAYPPILLERFFCARKIIHGDLRFNHHHRPSGVLMRMSGSKCHLIHSPFNLSKSQCCYHSEKRHKLCLSAGGRSASKFANRHMYNPEVFREENRDEIAAMIRSCGLATLVTNSPQGLMATPMPMLLAQGEGEHGVLHGHVAKANPQWKESLGDEALVIFQGVNAYISPAWYASKAETGRVVPTWDYVAVHVYGPVEFYHDSKRLLEVVTWLTDTHEAGRPSRWSVSDAPAEYVEGQLRAIVGVRIPIRRIDAKKKLNQRQSAKDRAGVKAGLAESTVEQDREVGMIIPGG
jgi:transcriptional regulator